MRFNLRFGAMEAFSNQVSVDIDGQRHTGNWTQTGDEITVDCAYGSRTVPVGRAPPDAGARRALREILLERGV